MTILYDDTFTSAVTEYLDTHVSDSGHTYASVFTNASGWTFQPYNAKCDGGVVTAYTTGTEAGGQVSGIVMPTEYIMEMEFDATNVVNGNFYIGANSPSGSHQASTLGGGVRLQMYGNSGFVTLKLNRTDGSQATLSQARTPGMHTVRIEVKADNTEIFYDGVSIFSQAELYPVPTTAKLWIGWDNNLMPVSRFTVSDFAEPPPPPLPDPEPPSPATVFLDLFDGAAGTPIGTPDIGSYDMGDEVNDYSEPPVRDGAGGVVAGENSYVIMSPVGAISTGVIEMDYNMQGADPTYSNINLFIASSLPGNYADTVTILDIRRNEINGWRSAGGIEGDTLVATSGGNHRLRIELDGSAAVVILDDVEIMTLPCTDSLVQVAFSTDAVNTSPTIMRLQITNGIIPKFWTLFAGTTEVTL